MKYDIYSETTKQILGWAATLVSAQHRASFFIDTNAKIYIRDNRSKKVVKILTKKDFQKAT
jgi:hypothetical protein